MKILHFESKGECNSALEAARERISSRKKAETQFETVWRHSLFSSRKPSLNQFEDIPYFPQLVPGWYIYLRDSWGRLDASLGIFGSMPLPNMQKNNSIFINNPSFLKFALAKSLSSSRAKKLKRKTRKIWSGCVHTIVALYTSWESETG